MSVLKRSAFLQAEFPHFREHIVKLENGPAIYSRSALQKKMGRNADTVIQQLVQIGFLTHKNGGKEQNIAFRFFTGPRSTFGRRAKNDGKDGKAG